MESSGSTLTEEQRRRIEENRRKALERRAVRFQESQTSIQRFQRSNDRPYKNEMCAVPSSSTYGFFNKRTNNKISVPERSKPNVDTSLSQSKNVSSLGLLIPKPIVATCVLITRKRFKLDVKYHPRVIDICKQIPSRFYDAKEKFWHFALQDHDKLVSMLRPLSPEVRVKPLPKTILNTFANADEKLLIPEVDLTILNDQLRDALLPFQREGVSFAVSKNGRVLIADDMGLGKTIQAIAIADYYRQNWPVLVVCPSSMRYVWQNELCQWLPTLHREDIFVISSAKDGVPDGKVVITSYDMMTKHISHLAEKAYQIVIFDESHFLKSSKSARTKASKQLTKKAKHIIMLSGTPALSRPAELYEQVSPLSHGLFSNFHEFGLRYCNATLAPWGWNYSGCSNMQELQLLLEETVMIRRVKSDVLTQLPSKQRQMVLLDPLSVRKHKSKALEALRCKINQFQVSSAKHRGVLLEYFHETSRIKTPAVCDYISDLLESGKKFLCFVHHQNLMNSICEMLDRKNCCYIRIDGAVNSETRKALCDKFQNDEECLIAMLSITAANTGITLTAAQLVVFAELFWNPGVLTQAEDRVHRIGQQECVVVQYLVAEGTADDHIWPLVKKKLNILNQAGLSKDNFNEADTVRVLDPTQTLLDDMFESLDSNVFEDDILQMDCQCSPPKKIKNA